MRGRGSGELVAEFPRRAHRITAPIGSEQEALQQLRVTQRMWKSLPSTVAPPSTRAKGPSPASSVSVRDGHGDTVFGKELVPQR